MLHKNPFFSAPFIVLCLAAVFLSGCGGNPPMDPKLRGEAYVRAYKAFQEIRSSTMRALDYPEYILRLRELDKTIDKIIKETKADDEMKKKLDYTSAPFRAALEQWNNFSQGKLGPEVTDIMPILRGQWKLGWERALELKAEGEMLSAE